MPRPIQKNPNDRYRVKKPTGIKDVPRFLKELIVPLFFRLVYIYKLV